MVNIHEVIMEFHVTRTLTNIDFSIVIVGYLVHNNKVVSSNITLYIMQSGYTKFPNIIRRI